MLYAKIYTNIRNDNLIANLPLDWVIEIKQDLKNFDETKIDLTDAPGILEYNKVEIVDELNNLVFSGYIYELEPYFDRPWMLFATVRGQKFIMKERKMLSDYNPSAVPVKDVLQYMLSAYNGYGEGWTLNCNMTTPVTIDNKTWDSYYDIMDELAEQCNAFRDVQDGILTFSTIIGVDRSVDSPDYQEIYYNGDGGTANNIANIRIVRTAKRANMVIWVSKDNTKFVASSGASTFIYWVVKETFRDWDLTTKTNELLNKLNAYQITYNITVENNTVNAKKGDKLLLKVENVGDKFDIVSPVRVLSKKSTYDNAQMREEITISTLAISETTLNNLLWKIIKDISLLST